MEVKMQNNLKGSFVTTGNIHCAGSAYSEKPLSLLFGMCHGAMEFNNRFFLYGDRLIRVNLNWIRDYILTMKGFRYTSPELSSFMDLLLEKQHKKGFFYEIIAPVAGDMHSGRPFTAEGQQWQISPDECCYFEEGSKFGLCRLELEADIEYLMCEGVFMIWQATGDDSYLEKNLPRLEKGLRYITSDPLRWDPHYQLAKRPRTLDTWDFLDSHRSQFDRAIHPDDPMGIFHGDNTGLFNAKLLMAKMYQIIGNDTLAEQHKNEAAALRQRIMKHLWNGRFFSHFLPLTPVDYGVDEKYQLSLSNSYALNRNILTLSEKLSVIETYRSLREKYKGELDDFRDMEPPYPIFHSKKAGEYVNGANAPFVAGQLALGAFESGEEEYGADILTRIGKKMIQDGKIAFLYDWEGKDIGGGPRCWSGAEVMNALTTGLAGVVDNSKLFRDITISPRFAAAGEDHAYVRLEYPISGAFTEYEWRSFDGQNKVEMTLKSTHDSCKVRMYVPKGKQPHRAWCNDCETGFETEKIANSLYAVIPAVKGGNTLRFEFK